MTYCQFVQAVEKHVKETAREELRITVHTSQKNNGVCRRGLLFSEEQTNISPAIYLEEYYRRFELGYPVEEIAKDILRLYDRMRFPGSWKDIELLDYEAVRDKIVYRLVNREANRERLKEIPYVSYLDLAIIFYVLLDSGENGTASMLVKNSHLKQWQVSWTEIYKRACNNTMRLLPYDFLSMSAAIGLDDVMFKEEDMFVLTNTLRCYGAAAILYPGRLRAIGEYLGEDYYILPSSVHETIILRAGTAPDREDLDDMVAQINRTEVEDEEVLSDHAYFYDRDHDRLEK